MGQPVDVAAFEHGDRSRVKKTVSRVLPSSREVMKPLEVIINDWTRMGQCSRDGWNYFIGAGGLQVEMKAVV